MRHGKHGQFVQTITLYIQTRQFQKAFNQVLVFGTQFPVNYGMKKLSRKNRKNRQARSARNVPMVKATERNTQKEYVGYNEPPVEAERIEEDLKENQQKNVDVENKAASPEFDKADLPERIDDDLGPELTDDRGKAEL